MSRIIIIGASGFSGKHVLKALLDDGHEVIAIKNKHEVPESSKVRVVPGGIGSVNHNLVDEVKPELVFHLARPRLPRLRRAGRVLAAYYASYLNGNLILELKKSEQKPGLIFTSGSLVYGSSPLPLDEDSEMHPASFARQYNKGERPLQKSMETGEYPVMMFRLPWLLGMGSWFEWFYLKPMTVAHSVPLFGKGDNLMDIIDIRDSSRLILKFALETKSTGNYNIVSGGAVTQLDFANKVSKVFGLPIKDYRQVFTGRLEKEAIQAFYSNIVLTTKYPEYIKDYHYLDLEESLRAIRQEYGRI